MRTIFKIIIPVSLVSIFCFSECKSQSGANTCEGSDLNTSDIQIRYIENEDMWCFTQEKDTIDYFIELRELRELGKLGEKIESDKTGEVAIAIRYENSAGMGGLFTYSEDSDADSLVVREEIPPVREFKVVDSRKQLHLLDMFVDSLSRKYNPLRLSYIDWQIAGAADAIVKISNDYYNSTDTDDPDGYSTLISILEESEMRHDLDSVLSKHGFRTSNIIIAEGIYYSMPIPESYSGVIDIPTDMTEILYFYTAFSTEPSHLTPTE